MSQPDQLFRQGQELAMQLFGNPLGDFSDLPINASDDFSKEMVTWVFGYLLKERSKLPIRVKVLGIIAMSVAIGQYDMLKRWLPAAKNSGCTRQEVHEAIITMVIYAGWPTGRKGLEILAEHWPNDPA